MLEWSDLRIVLAVQRAGTLSAAARALGVNQSTVTRRLAALQDDLGARVLERRGASYLLTPLGERMWPQLTELEDRALAVERAALGLDTRPAGTVRITTVDALAVRFLAPLIPHLRARLPEITLEIDSSPRALDLGRREADLALRLGRPRQDALVARKVGRMGFRLYASQSYLERKGHPKPGRMDGHQLIDDDPESTSPEVRWGRALTAGARPVVRMQTWQGRMIAAEAGAGVALLPCLLGDASPSLVRLGKPGDLTHLELWLLVHQELREVARIRVVFDWVAAVVEEARGRLEGLQL